MKCGYDSDMIRHLFFILFLLIAGRISLASPPRTEPTHFLRYVENADGSALEAAEATYKNDAGVVVHLISAVTPLIQSSLRD